MLSEMICRRSCQPQQQQQQQQQQQAGKDAPQRDRRKHGWSKSCRGRLQGRRTGGGGGPRGRRQQQHHQPQRHHHHHHHHQQQQQQHPWQLRRPSMCLRPVNMKGNRARGMRAPKNTNQFLMHEKYQMLHMRSDSVGSDSGSGSDSDPELTDMDSYLGVLENARGALLDSPDPHRDAPAAGPGPAPALTRASAPAPVLVFQEERLHPHEDSMQYFPSEDDLLQSQNFMQRDFVEFCDILTP